MTSSRAVLCLTSSEHAWFADPLETVTPSVTFAPATDDCADLDRFGLILVDGDGLGEPLTVVRELREAVPSVPVLFLTAEPDDERAEAALAAGADDCANGSVPAAFGRRVKRLCEEEADGNTSVDHPISDSELLEATLTDLLQDSDGLLYFKDADSRFIRVSESMAELYGRSREELRGLTDFDVMPEAKAAVRYENEQRILETGEVIEDPNERIAWSDGEMIWFHSKKMPLRDADGDIVGTLGLSRDVSEIKELEETLTELEGLMADIPVAALAVDARGEITWANDSAIRLLGEGEDDIVDLSLELLAGDGPLQEEFMQRYGSAFDSLLTDSTDEETVIDDVVIQRTPTDRRICDVHVRLLPLADDSFRGTAMAFHDVTTQAEQERLLERQYEQLERLVETISHDLRNPLLAAQGNLELARESVQQPALADADAALERLDILIDELVTMARVGRRVREAEDTSLATVTEKAWQPFDSSEASFELVADRTLRGDEPRLVRLFENLFRNAFEHGPDDVTIRVGATDEGFYVADDGDGVPADVRGQIFEHGFTTADDGTGLGLSIVAEIVAAHDWSIEVGDSEAGGARFDVRV